MQHMDRANTDGFLSLGERNRNAVTSHPYGWWNIHTSNRYMSENKKNVRYTLQLLWYENVYFNCSMYSSYNMCPTFLPDAFVPVVVAATAFATICPCTCGA